MSREMKHSGIPWIGDIPSHWEVMPHKRIMHKEKEIQEHYDGENILSLTMRGVIVRDLEAGGKMPTTFDGYQKVYANDLLQCLFDIDVTPRCVGLVRQDGLVSPAYSRFVMDANAYAPYYDYLLRFMDDNKVLLHLSKNIRSSLTETDYGTIYTCVPPLTEQKAIADYLDKHCAEVNEMVSLQEKIIEELRAYRQAIITETVTHGLNPNAPMKDSGVEWIGQIPQGWEVSTLKYVITTIESGVSVNAEQIKAVGEEYGVLKTSSVSSNYFIPTENKRVDKVEYNRVSCPVVRDTIIVSRMNTPELVGAAGYSCKDIPNLFLPDRLWQVHFNKKKLFVKYEWYYLISTPIKAYYSSLSSGTSSSMQNISKPQFYNAAILLPPLSEQQAIAEYLNKKTAKIDQLIAIKKQKIEELKAYKKSLIYEYVTGKKEVDG